MEIKMSIFGRIKDSIFGKKDDVGQGGQAAPAAAAAISQVDVEGILAGLAAKSGQPSNWKTSIVDLMKLLGLDSSLAERVNLAKELGYTGDTNDSATMNVWLIKQVMTKLAENGGKVSADLMH
jgi:pyridoxal biosynthesis lyase PdxS